MRVKPQDYWLWSFSDWHEYRKEAKAKAKAQRKAADRSQAGIDPREQYRLALFV